MFVDYVKITVSAGRGGHGCLAFHKEKFVPKGGPDGGDGGRGGSVIVIADPTLKTLLDLRYKKKINAENGQPGGSGLKTGRSGPDETIRVPVGTVIKNLETETAVADLDEPGRKVVIAKGGKGGHGNAYYKTAVNQAPRKAQDGWPGEQMKLSLELKLLADVGLVGLPNAGKSTILASYSAARPKIASYPFTTLVPNLGIVRLREYKSCVMADIPGLIEGASQGKGLGHQFLRHIQRTRLLIYVIDVNEDNILGTRETLERELVEFDPSLKNRVSHTVITKIDTVSESDLEVISEELPSDYIFISAVAHVGSELFLQAVEGTLDRL